MDAGEQCDDGNKIDNDSCDNNCQQPPPPPNCGNGVCNTGELCDTNVKCDTGAGLFTPGECRINCTYCGDGNLDPGEECDDGNAINNDQCSNDCNYVPISPNCGNNLCDPNESCDLNTRCIGGGIFTPGECRVDCTYCGDGIIQSMLGEVCDDGNTNNEDSCNNDCQVAVIPPGP